MGCFRTSDRKDIRLGDGVVIYEPCNIYGDARIGARTTIGAFCEIRGDVVIGEDCKIQSHCFIPEGVLICDGVFIGPHVCFTNNLWPRAAFPDKHVGLRPAQPGDWSRKITTVQDFASIGARAVILSGLLIGAGAMIGAGSVVTRDVEPRRIVRGNPARDVGHAIDRKARL